MRKIIRCDKTTALRIKADNRCALRPVPTESKIHFPLGLPAFEHIKDYTILMNDEVKPFIFLQSLHSSSLCFVCIEPFLICPDYSVTIPKATAATLGIEEPKDTAVLCLVTVARGVENTTANLLGPGIINLNTMTGQQIIAEDANYPVRYRIWESLQANKALHAAS